ncbi:MAG: glycosyltransferase family 4 protein [Candidatus Pacebacteria bacterium]|nr:glycosyltransferase family 4 protein [Candidatus Paceibacterota bacterium]
MKLLHLYSDWKWTGPAEPALQTCRSLMDRGHEIVFACCRQAMDYNESVPEKAREMGIEPLTRFGLDRHMPPLKTLHDLSSLPRYLAEERFDVVHCHLSHDHAFGGVCSRMVLKGRPAIVRSLYRRSVLRASLPNRFLLRRLTDGYVVFTDAFRDEYVRRFALLSERVAVSPMPVDLDRFGPGQKLKNMRAEFGIAADAPVIGIVGRFQKYRRADVFLEAASHVLQQAPEARFLVIGRSSQLQDTVIKPMEELGIADRVILTGYRIEDYVDTLACCDIFTLLMPGFDGTARAVREAMALGIPCVVANYGMLPEIVPHQQAGLVAETTPEALAEAWLQFVQDPETRAELGKGARRHAEMHFQLDDIAPCLEKLYATVAGKDR